MIWLRYLAALGVWCLVACAEAPVTKPLAVTAPRLDSAIARACDAPVALPDSADAAEVLRLMATDRAHLANCADRLRATATLYDTLRRDLGAH